MIASNDNWQDTQVAQITAFGLAPSDSHESVILTRLPAGKYTATVRSADDTTGFRGLGLTAHHPADYGSGENGPEPIGPFSRQRGRSGFQFRCVSINKT